MEIKKPEDIGDYKSWLKKEHNVEISAKAESYYDEVANKIKVQFENSLFWINLSKKLREFDEEYLVNRQYLLLTSGDMPELELKSFNSFLLKTFRKNILENKNWPKEPEGGWILPNDWFSKIDDIVRTLFVVKYLDGVEFFIDKIQSLCTAQDLKCNFHFEAKEEGYYAAHMYVGQEITIPSITLDPDKRIICVELQITTQLQDVIRKLLHLFYDKRRKAIKEENIKWQWDWQSDEFAVNYLGHILHYVEGMIMEIRAKQKEEI